MSGKTTQLKPPVVKQVSAFKQALENADIPVTKVIVFGSQAKGVARPDSDIDVAVVSPEFGKDPFDERRILAKLCEDLDIEIHPFHPDDLNDRWSTLAQEIRRYGIAV